MNKTLKEKHADLCSLIGEERTLLRLHSWYDRTLKKEKKIKGLVQNSEDPAELDKLCHNILVDLQNFTGISYRLTKDTKASIIARRNDGYSFEDFQKVHEIKTMDWLEDPINRRYLHPSTLYRPTKFDKYLTQYNMWKLDEDRKRKKKETTAAVTDTENMTAEEAERFKQKSQEIISNLKSKVRK